MHKPTTRAELNRLIAIIASGEADYNLGDIDVSEIKNMSGLFDMERLQTTVPKIVPVNFYDVYEKCEKNLDFAGLVNWDVSHVTKMSGMFRCCPPFNGGSLCGWNVSHVTDMSGMFEDCNSFTGKSLATWDVSSVTDMRSMFSNCWSFTGESLAGWDVSSVTDMDCMFVGCHKLMVKSLAKWNVSSVRSISLMFEDCEYFDRKILSGWGVSSEMFKKTRLTDEEREERSEMDAYFRIGEEVW